MAVERLGGGQPWCFFPTPEYVPKKFDARDLAKSWTRRVLAHTIPNFVFGIACHSRKCLNLLGQSLRLQQTF